MALLAAASDIPAHLAWLAAGLSLAVTAAAFGILWLSSLRSRDCSVVDVYWAFGFPVIAWVEIACVGRAGTAALVIAVLVTVWALRLGRHLVARHRRAGAEDPRYRAMRDAHGPGWERTSFWMVFMLQAICLWVIATPIHAVVLGMPGLALDPALAWALALAGLGAFLAGTAIEAAADAALARFAADPVHRGRLLTSGLFAWSRHPNYFGEALLWWGLGLLAFGITGQPLALLGPAVLHLLLVKVSGVPPLERHLSSRPGFADYVRDTPAFLPRPPRRPAPLELARRDPAE